MFVCVCVCVWGGGGGCVCDWECEFSHPCFNCSLSRSFPADVSVLYSCWPAGCCLGTSKNCSNFHSYLNKYVPNLTHLPTCDHVILVCCHLNSMLTLFPGFPWPLAVWLKWKGKPRKCLHMGHSGFINPRHACAARVTVVVLCVRFLYSAFSRF